MPKRRLVSLESAEFELWQNSAGESSRRIDSRVLKLVIDECLTQKQREYLTEYFFQEMNIPQIADLHGVAGSTVSRTLKRAKKRIFDALKYSVRH